MPQLEKMKLISMFERIKKTYDEKDPIYQKKKNLLHQIDEGLSTKNLHMIRKLSFEFNMLCLRQIRAKI